MLPLNNLTQLDHSPFPPGLDENDSDYFLESDKPLKSGVYKAKNIQKDVLQALTSVNRRYQQYSECISATTVQFSHIPTGKEGHFTWIINNFIVFKNNFITV